MHVVTKPNPPFLACGGRLVVRQVPAATDNLVWIATCAATGETALIDGPGAEEALACCREAGIIPTQIWITHTHGDHVGIAKDLLGSGLPVIGCRATADAIPGLTRGVDAGDTVRLGALEAKVLRTDGHLTGHISYCFEAEDGAVFCGDTMFAGGCGYLFDGPPEAMFASLLRLASLPPGTRICCAHEYTLDNLRFAWSVEPGNAALAERIRRVRAIRADGGCAVPSTLGEERATNPFLRPGSPELLARVAAETPELDASRPDRVFAATRALKDRKAYRSIPDAELPA
jgi:hydroxyacylglutathione hydrolase